jgi:hypothetical protein
MRICRLITGLIGAGMLVSADLHAQEWGNGPLPKGILYSGLENPVADSSGACPCKDIRFSTNNGRIIRKEDARCGTPAKRLCGLALLKPDTVGQAVLKVWCKRRKDSVLIATRIYPVVQVPMITPQVGGYRGGAVPAGRFRFQTGVESIFYSCFDMPCWYYPIISFTFKYTKQGGGTIVAQNEGANFSPEIQAIVGQLKPGDMVTISNVRCRYPDKSIQTLPAIVFSLQ